MMEWLDSSLHWGNAVIDRVIYAPELRNVLRVSIQAMYDWRENGRLPSDFFEGGRHRYLHSSVDRFFQRCIVHPDQPPPILAELLAYQAETDLPALLTMEEVAARWDVNRETVGHLLAKGKIPGIALSAEANTDRKRSVRIPVPNLSGVTVLTDHPDVVTYNFAAKMLGVGLRSLGTLVHDKLLDRVYGIGGGREGYVSIKSLRRLLAANVRNCTVKEWWKMQLAHDFAGLVSKEEALRRVRVHHRKLTGAMAGSLPYIQTPLIGKMQQVRLPFYKVREWHELQRVKAMTAAEIAPIFGVPEKLVAVWVAQRAFCRTRSEHVRPEICPRQSCITGYIHNHRTQHGFTATEWLLWVRQDRMAPGPLKPPLSQVEMATVADEGILMGVRLPDGGVTYAGHMVATVIARRRKARLEERRIMNG